MASTILPSGQLLLCTSLSLTRMTSPSDRSGRCSFHFDLGGFEDTLFSIESRIDPRGIAIVSMVSGRAGFGELSFRQVVLMDASSW